jgi:hypothetical protein
VRAITQVGVGTLVEFPVESGVNRSVATADVGGVIPLLSSTSHSFTFWTSYDLVIVRRGPHDLCVRACVRVDFADSVRAGGVTLRREGLRRQS